MPGVLIELGFVSHPDEAKYLSSESGKQEMSESISNAILAYKNDFFSGGEVTEIETVVAPKASTSTKTSTDFRKSYNRKE